MQKKLIKAYSNKYILTSPLKIQRVVKGLKDFNYNEILIILKFLPYRISQLLFKYFKSFLFNLYNKKKIDILFKLLTLKKSFNIGITRGPILKRLKSKSKGKSTIIKKRMSHIFIYLN